MARTRKALPARVDDAHLISAGVLASVFQRALTEYVLASTGRASQRERLLPAPAVVYYGIALILATCHSKVCIGKLRSDLARRHVQGHGDEQQPRRGSLCHRTMQAALCTIQPLTTFWHEPSASSVCCMNIANATAGGYSPKRVNDFAAPVDFSLVCDRRIHWLGFSPWVVG
jgi:hypothetical protein